MESMQAFITAHPYWAWAAALTAGAIVSWLSQVRTGNASINPINYWLLDDKAHAYGTIGVLVSAAVGPVFAEGGSMTLLKPDGTLAMTWQYLVMTAFTLGLSIDASIQPKQPALQAIKDTAPPVQGGFARVLFLVLLMALTTAVVPLLPGCANMQGAAPQTKNQTLALTANSISQVYQEIGFQASTGAISEEQKIRYIQKTDVALLMLKLVKDPQDAEVKANLQLVATVFGAAGVIDAASAKTISNIVSQLDLGVVPSKDDTASWLMLGSTILTSVSTELSTAKK